MDDANTAVRKYIIQAFSGLNIESYAQEPAYVAALMGRLQGIAWNNEDGAQVSFSATIVNDRGRGSAEHKYGADFAITIRIVSRDNTTINKSVLGQAKKGEIEGLTNNELYRLEEQCNKMSKYTTQMVVLETPTISGQCPSIRIIEHSSSLFSSKRLAFQDYLINEFISCRHGDTRDGFVSAVEDSSLSRLEIFVKGLKPNLDPAPRRARPGF